MPHKWKIKVINNYIIIEKRKLLQYYYKYKLIIEKFIMQYQNRQTTISTSYLDNINVSASKLCAGFIVYKV